MLCLKFLVVPVIHCLVGYVVCFPGNEFESVIDNGEFAIDEKPFSKLMGIIPSGYSPHKNVNNKIDMNNENELSDLFDKFQNDENIATFNEFVKNGHTKKGLTFNIYDDNHRGAAISLFRLLQSLEEKPLQKFSQWAEENINSVMYDYVKRLAILHGINLKPIPPPFITKPNYFVNSETIYKAATLKSNEGRFHPDDGTVKQYFRTDDTIFINTNYSGWNAPDKECTRKLNYFREDIGFNSYAYGLKLLMPFWMPNIEIELKNPGLFEFVYYKWHYLYARYLLEFKHSEDRADTTTPCIDQYDSNLVYDNGLRFPIRPPYKFSWNEGKALISSLDVTIKELLKRGVIIMDGGTHRINITEENHVDLIIKLVRANMCGVRVAKVAMDLLGYNAQENVLPEIYNPAPSVIHHEMTQSRDPAYLEQIILNILNYVTEYKYAMSPLELVTLETNEFEIIEAAIPDLTTYFSYYSFDIGKATNDYKGIVESPLVLAARQRRLTHLPFQFDFTVDSAKETNVSFRLFLGPQCTGDDCWVDFPKFLELDLFRTNLKEGLNNVTWSPNTSGRYSYDDYYNLENKGKKDRYNMYKFPESLLIPRGHANGLNLTLFVIITPNDKATVANYIPDGDFYQELCSKIDEKPLGFPFHKQAIGYNPTANNYRLFDITIFHKKSLVDRSGYYSKDLY